jgi:hypothetical protein
LILSVDQEAFTTMSRGDALMSYPQAMALGSNYDLKPFNIDAIFVPLVSQKSMVIILLL